MREKESKGGSKEWDEAQIRAEEPVASHNQAGREEEEGGT